MALKIEDTLENKKRARYLKRYYGWKPASEIAQKLGFVSTGALAAWCSRRDIPNLLNQPGILSTYKLGPMLGVHTNTIVKWAERDLLPSYIGYKTNTPVYVFYQEEIELWLMTPRPAWVLVKPDKMNDPKLKQILLNAQTYNVNYWASLQEVAQTYYISPSALRKQVFRGRIESYVLSGKRWIYVPSVQRYLQTPRGGCVQ